MHLLWSASVLDNQMLWAIGETGDVGVALIVVVGDDQRNQATAVCIQA